MKIQIRIQDLLVYNRVNHFNKLTLIGSLAEFVLHVTLLPLYFRQLKKGSHNSILTIMAHFDTHGRFVRICMGKYSDDGHKKDAPHFRFRY